MDNKKLTYIIVAVVILVAGGISFWYWPQGKVQEPVEPVQPSGAVGNAEALSESVPEIETNAGEKVPEVNPLDRANPFKYNNPLR